MVVIHLEFSLEAPSSPFHCRLRLSALGMEWAK